VRVPYDRKGYLEHWKILSREVRGSKGVEKLGFIGKRVRWSGFLMIGYMDLSIGYDPLM
jgi:hypothetical protein